VHEWVSVFDLPAKGQTLVWEYESRDAFKRAQGEIHAAGWFVEKAIETSRSVNAGRVAVMGPAAWLNRSRHVRATLRRRGEQAKPVQAQDHIEQDKRSAAAEHESNSSNSGAAGRRSRTQNQKSTEIELLENKSRRVDELLQYRRRRKS
jgi:hypothetical protein